MRLSMIALVLVQNVLCPCNSSVTDRATPPGFKYFNPPKKSFLGNPHGGCTKRTISKNYLSLWGDAHFFFCLTLSYLKLLFIPQRDKQLFNPPMGCTKPFQMNNCLTHQRDKQLFNPPRGCTKTFQMKKYKKTSFLP